MPSDIVKVEFTETLRQQFNQSDLRRRAKTDPEAIRNAISKAIDAEQPRRRSRQTPAIARVNKGRIRTQGSEAVRESPVNR